MRKIVSLLIYYRGQRVHEECIDTVEESTQMQRLRWKPAEAEDIGLRCCMLGRAEICVEELRQIRNSPMYF